MTSKNKESDVNTKEVEEEDEEEDSEIDSEVIKYIFNDTERIQHHVIGICQFPTGRLLTADPLCYLQRSKDILYKSKKIKPGSYSVELSIIKTKTVGLRIVGARLKISEETAFSYEPAFCENKGKETEFYGFPVDAGMACFCDEESVKSYWTFLDGWYKKNKDDNIYDNYFAALFEESYKEYPDLQRKGGDFLLWKNPIDDSMIPMFASGLGDGFYNDFWGIDKKGEICELVTVFFNPKYFE